MSMTYIMYMAPTYKEAKRIGMMAKRIHKKPLDRCVMISPFGRDEEAIYREPQYGRPRVRCFFKIGTRNSELAGDDYAWDRAIELYDRFPYWLAYLLSHLERFRRVK